jgi:hypothetical protein
LCVLLFCLYFERSKHSTMITFEDNNNTESGNPSHFQKKKSTTFTDFIWPCNLKHNSC